MSDRTWTGVIQRGYRGAWAVILLALPAATAGCADHVQSSLATCPCSQGMTCCSSGVCADDETACEQATSALSNDSAGHWTGYIENFAFASGSGALDLTLTAGTDGSLSGQLILGMGTPPPPATDGTVGWPIGAYSYATSGDDIAPIEGYGYHIQNVKWTALRLQFTVNIAEPWGPWCRLQTSYLATNAQPAFWLCVPGGGAAFTPTGCSTYISPSETLPLDCGVAYLCSGTHACSCSAAGCDAGTSLDYAFDVALRNDDGDGSVVLQQPMPSGVTAPMNNVRLLRASN